MFLTTLGDNAFFVVKLHFSQKETNTFDENYYKKGPRYSPRWFYLNTDEVPYSDPPDVELVLQGVLQQTRLPTTQSYKTSSNYGRPHYQPHRATKHPVTIAHQTTNHTELQNIQ